MVRNMDRARSIKSAVRESLEESGITDTPVSGGYRSFAVNEDGELVRVEDGLAGALSTNIAVAGRTGKSLRDIAQARLEGRKVWDPTRCRCGCGAIVRRRRIWINGHDAKHMRHLLGRIAQGDELAYEEIIELGWAQHVPLVDTYSFLGAVLRNDLEQRGATFITSTEIAEQIFQTLANVNPQDRAAIMEDFIQHRVEVVRDEPLEDPPMWGERFVPNPGKPY